MVPQSFLHPTGLYELRLPTGWIQSKHDPENGQYVFRPAQSPRGEVSIQALTSPGSDEPGYTAQALGQLFKQLSVEPQGETHTETADGTETSWRDGVWNDPKSGRPEAGRSWLHLRGKQVIYGSYACARESWDAAQDELSAAHDLFKSLSVLELVALEGLNLGAFAADLMRTIRPDLTVENREGQLVLKQGERATMRPFDLLRSWCAQQPATVRPLVARYVRELAAQHPPENDPPPPWEEARRRVRPLLRPDVFLQETARPGFQPASTPVVEKLFTCYGLEDAYHMPYVTKPWLESWGISLEELHRTAVQNLSLVSEGIPLETAGADGRVTFIQCEVADGYTASRLVSPTFLTRLSAHLGERFVVAVPSCDRLLALLEPPADGLAKLKQQVVELMTLSPFPVTHLLIRCTVAGGQATLTAIA